jgi:hypothetical protein
MRASQVNWLDGSGVLRVHFKQQTPPVPQVTLFRALVALAVSFLGEYNKRVGMLGDRIDIFLLIIRSLDEFDRI